MDVAIAKAWIGHELQAVLLGHRFRGVEALLVPARVVGLSGVMMASSSRRRESRAADGESTGRQHHSDGGRRRHPS